MADHPWTDPRPGDTCTPAGGRTRTVKQVSYRGARDWASHPKRLPGDWPDRVVYEDARGIRTITASTWATQCRAAVAGGGKYERAAEAVAAQPATLAELLGGGDH